jgi:acetylornithine deacetylase ArgE
LQTALEITSHLISYPTISPKGNELECAKYVFDYLKDLKIDDSEVDIHEFDGSRANVVATFGASKDPGLLLSGHMDVVPSGNRESWQVDPFRASVKNDRLFGRGASDMKGGLASIMKAVENTVKSTPLKRRLVFVATAGEETGFIGMSKLIQNSIVTSNSATCVVIGEPTDLKPARAHRGIYRLKVEFFGKSAHASTPELGINAIEYACKLVESLEKVRDELDKTKDELLGVTTLTPTMISGGIGENVVPPNTEIILDSRRLPVHSSELVHSKVDANCRNLGVNYKISELVNHEPLDTPEGSFITKLTENLTGARSVPCPFGTEGSLYWGTLRLPTIVLGPGTVEQAHVDNEYVELSQIDRAVQLYSSLIQQLCF